MKTINNYTWWKNIALLFLVFAITPSINSCKQSQSARSKILKIYNWADYMDEDLLTEFPEWYKEQTGEEVEIMYQVFDMTEVMYTKIALGKEDFDLVCPTQAIIERMMYNDMLLPIQKNFGQTDNYLGNISPFIRDRLSAFGMKEMKAEDYVVPYMWGTSGIMFNSDLISVTETESWACLWDPKNKGKVLMKDSYWDAYNISAIYGFYPEILSGKRSIYQVANDHHPSDITMVEKKLHELKPNLAGWEADFGKEMMTKGEIWLSYAWSGDAVWAIEEAASVGVNLAYTVPREGSNIWFDGWVIPKYAQNILAASYFLNYICQSEIALRNMDISGYTSAVSTPEIMEAQIDSSLTEIVNLSYFFGPGNDILLINPIQYPDSSIVNRCAIFHDFLDKNDTVLEMWSRAKGDSLNRGMAIMILGFFLTLLIWQNYRRLRKYRSRRRRLGKSSYR
jgi:spermidine/putrescine transport system substrate-binding protein